MYGHKHASFISNHIVNYSVPRHQHHQTVQFRHVRTSHFKTEKPSAFTVYSALNEIKQTSKV